MAACIPEVENLPSEDLLSLVLSMVAPAECDPQRERGLRFEAQRAATELYCRAVSAGGSHVGGTVTSLRGV